MELSVDRPHRMSLLRLSGEITSAMAIAQKGLSSKLWGAHGVSEARQLELNVAETT